MKNPLSLSEDELKETPEDSLVATTETDTDDVEDVTTDTTDGEPTEEGSSSVSEEVNTDTSEPINTANSDPELTNDENVSTVVDNKSETATDVDYKGFYDKVLAPFKASGNTVALKTPEEAIHLMQQGVDYTKKMQSIAPYRKTLMMLEKNGLLDEDTLSFLVDLKNKNPEAIKKYFKDTQIDPLDIDTTDEPNYVAGSNKISDQEANFRMAIKDIQNMPGGNETLQYVSKTWDDESQNMLLNNPQQLQYIYEQMQNGVYSQITQEMARQQSLGQINPTQPFLTTYIQVGNMMLQQRQNRQPVATKVGTRNSLSNGDKVRQAGLTRNSPNTAKTAINPLAMSEEEFLKFMQNKY